MLQLVQSFSCEAAHIRCLHCRLRWLSRYCTRTVHSMPLCCQAWLGTQLLVMVMMTIMMTIYDHGGGGDCKDMGCGWVSQACFNGDQTAAVDIIQLKWTLDCWQVQIVICWRTEAQVVFFYQPWSFPCLQHPALVLNIAKLRQCKLLR